VLREATLQNAPMKFISLRVRNALLMHGYTPDNQEIVQEFKDEAFVDKLIAVERIQSLTEKYVLVTSSHGRVMYWEYDGSLASVKARLATAGLAIE
jgi:hypothetical protein